MEIMALAFADGSVLVSRSVRGMRRILRVLESFRQLAGLSLQPNKCFGFLLNWCIVNHCQPWQLRGPSIHIIPPPKPETVCYLGVQVGRGHDLRAPDLILRLQE